MKKYRAYEDNGGGLYLAFYGKDGKLESLHSGYEYRSAAGGIMEDVKAEQADPDDNLYWDNNELKTNPYGDYSAFAGVPRCGLAIIADNEGVYPEHMGVAGRIEFGIK